MGIKHLHLILREYYAYFLKNKQKKKEISNICYIDCTAKIYNLFHRVFQYDKLSGKIEKYNSIYEVVTDFINSLVSELIHQINTNKFYDEYYLIFDYSHKHSIDPNLKFDDKIYNFYYEHVNFNQFNKKEKISAIPFINSKIDLLNTSLFDLKTHVFNNYEIRYSYWNPKKNINNYSNINWLIKKIKIYLSNCQNSIVMKKDNVDKKKNDCKKIDSLELIKLIDENNISEIETISKIYEKLVEIKKFSFYKYLISRGLKKLSSNNKKWFNDTPAMLEKNYSTDEKEFSKQIIKSYYEISPSLIISLLPYITKLIKEETNKKITILGCEEESDFVIRKHVLTHHKYHYPTICTYDTDLIMLLSDIECLIKIKTKIIENEKVNKINLVLNTKDFWNWVLYNKRYEEIKYTFEDIITICSRMGTSYNKYASQFKLQSLNSIRNTYQKNFYQLTMDEIHSSLDKIMKKDLKGKYEPTNQNDKSFLGIIQLLATLELFNQLNYIEIESRPIKSENEIDKNKIELTLFDTFTELLFLEIVN